MNLDEDLKNLGFKVLKAIGQGSYGTIMLAKSKRQAKVVALKIIDGSMEAHPHIAATYMPREVAILKEVAHPHIIHVHEIHMLPSGQVVIVMDVAAMDLMGRIVEERYTVPTDLVKKWFGQILSALIHLHDQDIAHRDIKCENVLLMADDEAMLTDFGLSCFTRGFPYDLQDMCCGTIPYIAPEMLIGAYDAKKCDVWSLGVLLYNLVTGDLPFDAYDLESLWLAHKEPLRFPEGIMMEESCRALITYMLELDPLTRPTMREVAQHPWVKPKEDGISRVNGRFTVTSINEEAFLSGIESIQGNNKAEEEQEEEYGCCGCFPLCHAVKRAAKAVFTPIAKASRSVGKSIRNIFKRKSVV